MLNFQTLMGITKSKHLTSEEILALPHGTYLSVIKFYNGGGKIITVKLNHSILLDVVYWRRDNLHTLVSDPQRQQYILITPGGAYLPYEKTELNKKFAVIPLVYDVKL